MFLAESAETFADDSKTDPSIMKIYNMNGIASKKFRSRDQAREISRSSAQSSREGLSRLIEIQSESNSDARLA